ncbi:CBP80/20-dependent translation initiation factor-like [Macrobrachium nipponense]|uniref:CBP80/20-dependent translation initiation factor-like n=1 Tax=Macrobrachium nipponense TaxID=159736 RepID=UPI0030C7E646
MPARGRGCPISQGEALRRPGQINDEINPAVVSLIDNILSIKSPDDIQVSKVAVELKDTVKKFDDLQYCVTELCNRGLRDRTCSPVVAKVFGLTAQHFVGDCKVLSLLLRRVQTEYQKKDELAKSDRNKFVTSALFLGEVFHHVQSEKKTPFKVLVEPVLNYLDMIMRPHLTEDQREDIDDDMSVVSKQLLQSGDVLCEFNAEGVLKVVQDVTEVLCRRELNMSTRVNLLTALAELWPRLATYYNARTIHAQLANRLEVSLKI